MNKILGILGILLIVFTSSTLLINSLINSEDSVSEPFNPNLEKYRSDDLPEDCRLPEYESDPVGWKEHLSHHKQTWYCLDYYEDVETID